MLFWWGGPANSVEAQFYSPELASVYKLAAISPRAGQLLDSIADVAAAHEYRDIPEYQLLYAKGYVASRQLNPVLSIHILGKLWPDHPILKEPYWYLRVVCLLANEHTVLNHYEESVAFFLKGLEKAREIKDNDYQARILLQLAQIQFLFHRPDEGRKLLQKAGKAFSCLKDNRKYLGLADVYDYECDFYRNEGRYAELEKLSRVALNYLSALTSEQKENTELAMKQGYDLRQMRIFLNLAYALEAQERKEEAWYYYQKVDRLWKFNMEVKSREIWMRMLDFLMLAGKWKEALVIGEKYAHAGAVGNDPEIKQILGKIYQGLGEYEKAFYLLRCSNVIKDSLNQRMSKQKAQELYMAYEAIEKEHLIMLREEELMERSFLLEGGLVAVIMLFVFVARQWQFNCVLKKKKRYYIERVNYLRQRKEELETLKNKLSGFEKHKLRVMEEKMDKNRISKYVRLQEIMQEQRPYLDFSLGRDQLAALVHTNRQYISEMVKLATGLSVNAYINAYRLEYARLLLLQTDLKIENIAIQAGFKTSRTFHRLFRKEFGITPAAFRYLVRTFC